MSWNFDDLLKGQVTQAILQSVLERVGYRVRRLGVEELIPEVRENGESPIYGNLPEGLRFLPDFLVIDPDLGDVHLTEVKFRREVSDVALKSLVSEMARRRLCWPQTETVVMVAGAPNGRGFHQDHIRVITADDWQKLEATDQSPPVRWERLPQLQTVYRRLHGSFDNQQIADSVTRPLRDLSKIQRPLTLEEKLRLE